MNEVRMHQPTFPEIEEAIGASLPFPQIDKIPRSEKQLAVAGAMELQGDLTDQFHADLETLRQAGEISAATAQGLFRGFCESTGSMMDYVHAVVGYVGNHGDEDLGISTKQ